MTRWLLKTVAADGATHGGFVWPLEVGAEVTAPDWSDAIECGGGLHGLLDGRGDGPLLSWSPGAVWLVAEVPADARLVDLVGKVKVDRCVVAHVGDRLSATGFLAEQGQVDGVVGAHVVAGYYGTATAGYGGAATAGYRGTATAGDYGTIVLAWWDDKLARRRWVAGDVGIDGIKADTPYRCEDGRLVEVES